MSKSTTEEECGKGEQSRGRGPRCFNYHQLGHIAAKCPSSAAMFCCGSDCRKQPAGGGECVYQSKCLGISYAGTVEGTAVSDIMLDTGATRTLVWRDLVPKEKIGGGEISICCVHGDIVVYPLAEVQIAVDGVSYSVEAAVSETLPVSVLLGRDVPELVSLRDHEGARLHQRQMM